MAAHPSARVGGLPQDRRGSRSQRTLTAALQIVLISLRAARTATAFTAWPRNAARAKVQTGAEVLAIVTATIVND